VLKKPLKRFGARLHFFAPLKRGVNERAFIIMLMSGMYALNDEVFVGLHRLRGIDDQMAIPAKSDFEPG